MNRRTPTAPAHREPGSPPCPLRLPSARRSATFACLILASSAGARPVEAQAPPPAALGAAARDAGPDGLVATCADREPERDGVLDDVARVLSLGTPEAIRSALDAREPGLRRAAAEAPGDVTAQYRLAALMGARLEHRSGVARVSGAKELHTQVLRVLDLAPEHPGASHILGRLHAGVLRLDRVTRFLATQLLGGAALKGASWDEARALLELAERTDPCVPEHHYELARVYAELGSSAAAGSELAHVLELTAGGEGGALRIRERAERLGREWKAAKE